jgi:hypothetical protein
MKRRDREERDWMAEAEAAAAGPEVEICPLCGRGIPLEQRELHHLVPKLKGGKVTQSVHSICHRQIHALFSEAELARRYNTIEALLEHEEIRKFVDWVRKKPDDFNERAHMTRRRRER